MKTVRNKERRDTEILISRQTEKKKTRTNVQT